VAIDRQDIRSEHRHRVPALGVNISPVEDVTQNGRARLEWVWHAVYISLELGG
jgi:hypothetical protein